MIRTTVPTSVRKGTALAGVAGLLVLAGCSGTADAEDQSTDTGTDTSTESTDSGAAAGGDYTAAPTPPTARTRPPRRSRRSA